MGFEWPGVERSNAMLELYQAESCPYSEEVRSKLTDLGVSYVVHNPRLPGDEGGDVLNEQTHGELTAIGGEDTIPFLLDRDREEAVYDAEDIVDYLERHYE